MAKKLQIMIYKDLMISNSLYSIQSKKRKYNNIVKKKLKEKKKLLNWPLKNCLKMPKNCILIKKSRSKKNVTKNSIIITLVKQVKL